MTEKREGYETVRQEAKRREISISQVRKQRKLKEVKGC